MVAAAGVAAHKTSWTIAEEKVAAALEAAAAHTCLEGQEVACQALDDTYWVHQGEAYLEYHLGVEAEVVEVVEGEGHLQDRTFLEDHIENHYDPKTNHQSPFDADHNDLGHDVYLDDTTRCDHNDS